MGGNEKITTRDAVGGIQSNLELLGDNGISQ